MARASGMDLVEVAPNATPPVCRIVNYGKYRYEQAKKEKESRKHQHAGRVKEIQLTASIHPHDLQVKLGHAADFLCEDMKVKVSLRFRGREMAHQEIGREVVARFLTELTPYGVAAEHPRLIGRGLNVIITPLPRNRRAKNPRTPTESAGLSEATPDEEPQPRQAPPPNRPSDGALPRGSSIEAGVASDGFVNNPFAQLDEQAQDRQTA